MAQTWRVCCLTIAGLCIAWSAPSLAQSDEGSRGVRIIDAVPGAEPAPPATETPSPPLPSLTPPTSPEPPLPATPSVAAPSLTAPSLTAPPEVSPQPAALPDPSLPIDGKAENSAGVAVDILPRRELAIGDRITLRVMTRRPGYLVLVDIDASGKITQIYPNTRSLLLAASARETANRIEPGRAVTIPDRKNPFAGFEFVAAAPGGAAMVVAILSDRPVQLLDLPSIPPELVGQPAALDFLSSWARGLRIARPDPSKPLQETLWSFAAQSYVIR